MVCSGCVWSLVSVFYNPMPVIHSKQITGMVRIRFLVWVDLLFELICYIGSACPMGFLMAWVRFVLSNI